MFGAFLLQLVVGAFPGTFGNMLPYFTSYKRQDDPSLNHGDLAIMLNSAGITIGLSSFAAGTLLMPVLGKRVCLLVGCTVYIIASSLGYFLLDFSVEVLSYTYGGIFGCGLSLMVLPTIIMPVTWFPNHKGKVVGFTMSGMGLSSLVFAPLQTYLINPNNISPVVFNGTNGSSSGSYFTSPEILSNLPNSLLYLSATYASLIAVGFILCTEKQSPSSKDGKQDLTTLKSSLGYLVKVGLRRLDFYMLFITRYCLLTVAAGVAVQWKTLGLEVSSDDKLISVVGGLTGVFNAISRLVSGTLMDKMSYRYLMVTECGLLSICLGVMVPTAFASFNGYIVLTLLIYLLNNGFFITIPTQVVTLFGTEHSSIIIGALGLADSLALGSSALLNLLFKLESPFLPFYLGLAGFAFLATILSGLTRDTNISLTQSQPKQEH